MFRRAVFALSRRETIMAPHTEEQFAQTVAWMILAYTQAIVEKFRQHDAVTKAKHEQHLEGLVYAVVHSLFKTPADTLVPNFLQRYETDDVLLDLAHQMEQGAVALRSQHRPGAAYTHAHVHISHRITDCSKKLPSPGYQRPWAVLANLASAASLYSSSSFELDAAKSLWLRTQPILPKLRSIGSPCSLAAASMFEFLNSWDLSQDMALVFLP